MFRDVEPRKKAVGVVLGRKSLGHKRVFEIENCAVDREINLEALTLPDYSPGMSGLAWRMTLRKCTQVITLWSVPIDQRDERPIDAVGN